MQIPSNVGVEDECACMHFAAETWPIDFFPKMPESSDSFDHGPSGPRCESVEHGRTHDSRNQNIPKQPKHTKTYQNILGSTRFVSAGIRRGCRNGVGEVLRALVASVEALKR